MFCFSVFPSSMELITHRVMPAMVRNIPVTASAESKECGGGYRRKCELKKTDIKTQSTTSTVFFKERRKAQEK